MARDCTNMFSHAGAAIFASLALVFGAYADVNRAADSTSGSAGSRILGSGNPLAGDCPVSSGSGGDWTLTQSQSDTEGGGQVACAEADVGTTRNGWARCFNLEAEGVPAGVNLTINSVTFGVGQATMDGINVDVVLYIDCDGCPPGEIGLDVTEIARASTVVNIADEGGSVTVNFPGGPVVAAGTDLIVEVENLDDGTEEPFFSFRAGSNADGQCGPSYLRALDCGFAAWVDTADIGFEDSMLILSVDATEGGTPDEECPDVPAACNEDAGPCDEAHDGPGCNDTICCSLVCAVNVLCCIEGFNWDQDCVDEAIAQGCVEQPCIVPTGDEGVPVPAGDNFDSYADGFPLTGVNGWGGWDDTAGVVANVSTEQFRSAPNSLKIDTSPSDDDQVQQYVGAYCEGQWTYTAWQYIPSDALGDHFFILLNTYEDGGDKNWSTQVRFSAPNGIVEWDFDFEQLPLITDEWVEIRVEIDLDADSQQFFYGGQLLGTRLWTDNNFAGGPGQLWIRALDLYANAAGGASVAYYDDVSIAAAIIVDPCDWDLTEDGEVGLADLLKLLEFWGDPYGLADLLDLLAAWGPCP